MTAAFLFSYEERIHIGVEYWPTVLQSYLSEAFERTGAEIMLNFVLGNRA